jgi:rhodanese-related sulfurtransferase
MEEHRSASRYSDAMHTFYGRLSLRDALLPALLALTLIATGCGRKITDNSIANIQTPELARLVRETGANRLYMDVRDPEAYGRGHIPGAKNIRLQDVSATEKSPNFDSYKMIVVYGEDLGSARAIAMTKRLLGVGYDDVFLLEGGFAGWRAGGGTIERN